MIYIYYNLITNWLESHGYDYRTETSPTSNSHYIVMHIDGWMHRTIRIADHDSNTFNVVQRQEPECYLDLRITKADKGNEDKKRITLAKVKQFIDHIEEDLF